MLESYVFEAHKAHSLESLAFRHLGRTALTYEEVCGKGVNQIPFAQVSVERATAYAAENADMMSGILLYAFAAALIGGIDSPGGAVVGGFLVGVLENVLGAYVVGNELKLGVALVLIIGVLLFKPSGLFGSVQVTRV